ncbi:MAG: SPOR domain-containing protein, partial [Octadecabacter sp.]
PPRQQLDTMTSDLWTGALPGRGLTFCPLIFGLSSTESGRSGHHDAEAAAPTPATALPVPSPRPTAAPSASGLDRAFIQIGIFSVEDNARGTADRLRGTGIVPTVLEQTSQGRTFWRVIVGPASSESERAELLRQVKAQGFEDAYFVTN